MFGYIQYDKPHLYFKDYNLYSALYCGVCKGIAKTSGQAARFALTYDIAFMSALLHNIRGEDVKISRQRCIEHPLISRPMAETDELTERLGALNTILAYYKLTDDIADGDKGKAGRIFIKKGYKKAKRKYPELDKIVAERMKGQEKIEKEKCDSIDRAADNSACMIAELSDALLGEKANYYTNSLFYSIGKWIYLIDALDDYDKDKKKNSYNVFLLCYGEESKRALVNKRGDELAFIFDSVFKNISECRKNISFGFNTDLIDNILFRGMPQKTKSVFESDGKNKKEEK